jgi:hypothetical protein
LIGQPVLGFIFFLLVNLIVINRGNQVYHDLFYFSVFCVPYYYLNRSGTAELGLFFGNALFMLIPMAFLLRKFERPQLGKFAWNIFLLVAIYLLSHLIVLINGGRFRLSFFLINFLIIIYSIFFISKFESIVLAITRLIPCLILIYIMALIGYILQIDWYWGELAVEGRLYLVTFPNPIDMAGLVVFPLAIILYTGRMSFLKGIFISLSLLVLLLTQSRWILFSLLMAYLFINYRHYGKRKTLYSLVTALSLGFVVLIGLMQVLPQHEIARLVSFHNVITRAYAWNLALSSIQESGYDILLGHGVGNIEDFVYTNRSPTFNLFGANAFYDPENFHRIGLHNYYLERVIDSGLLYLLLFVRLVLNAFKYNNRSLHFFVVFSLVLWLQNSGPQEYLLILLLIVLSKREKKIRNMLS